MAMTFYPPMRYAEQARRAMAEAIVAAGGVGALAKQLRVHRQTIYAWDRVPAERVLSVEEISGVPREELRPDLFRTPRPKGVRAPAAWEPACGAA